MALKFNTLKSIKQALIGPNILFPAAYLLFSAEVCSGGMPKNQLSSQISRITPLSLAAKSVDQLNNIEELEDVDPNTDGLDLFHRYQSVIPVPIRKPVVLNDRGASQKKIASVAHTDKVDESLVSNQAEVEDVSPEQSLGIMVIDPSNKLNEKADKSDHTADEANDPDIKQKYTLNMLKYDYSSSGNLQHANSKSRMRAILRGSPTQYMIDLRHFFIEKSLEAYEGAYGYSKVDAVEWFFKQPVQDIAQQYDRSILELVIKQVQESNHSYSSSVMDSVQALMGKIG